ncbi:MAG: T9SS type A sorting domain-containing protein [Candidatus Eisenbacteria bacterium]
MRTLLMCRLVSALLAALACLSAGGPALAVIDPAGGFGGGPIAGSVTITVIDEVTGVPVENAYCQIGPTPGVPFAGNGARTNASGIAVFSDPSLSGPQTVTAGKEGYAFLTVYGVDAGTMILPIREQGTEVERPTYQGDISGFNIVWNDGIVDLALVWRTFFVRELLSFATDLLGGSFERFAPTIGETFPLVGLQGVPGAIYLPLQIELGLIPLSRTPYVIYVDDQTTTDIGAVYAKMPLMTLLNELGSDKPDLLALLAEFDVRKYALEEGIVVNGPGEQDLSLTIAEGAPVRIRVANTAPDMDVLCVAVADLDGLSGFGRLMPSGFAGTPGGVNTVLPLSTLGSGVPGSPDYLAGALQTDTVEGIASTASFDRSGLVAGDTANATEFLEVPAPSLGANAFTWTSVANLGAGLFPDVHRAGLSLVTTIPDTAEWAEPGDTLDIPTPLWTFLLGADDTSFTLPCLGTEIPSPVVDPAETPDQDRLDWSITGIRLGLEPSFDYDDWDLVDLGLSGTHLASNTEKFVAAPESPYTAVVSAGVREMGALGLPAPNPFRSRTTVRFHVAASAENARLDIFDISGRKVRTLFDGGAAGRAATWDGKDDRGRDLPSGLYLMRLETGGETHARKVLRTR